MSVTFLAKGDKSVIFLNVANDNARVILDIIGFGCDEDEFPNGESPAIVFEDAVVNNLTLEALKEAFPKEDAEYLQLYIDHLQKVITRSKELNVNVQWY